MNIQLNISGRVQGVGFRFAAKQRAIAYNLSGWVRNLPDGTVELEIEGEPNNIEGFLVELKAGFNPFIKIEVIHSKEGNHMGYKKFEIK